MDKRFAGTAVRAAGDPTALLETAADWHRTLATAGLPVAAAYAVDACRSIRLAIAAAATAAAREDATPSTGDGGPVPLTGDDGRETGVWTLRDGDGSFASRGRVDAHGRFTAEPDAGSALPACDETDPCWDLLGSMEARAFVQDDLSAALLAAALSDFGWIAPGRRVRAQVTRGAAALAVRALRDGRPVATLRRTAPPLLDRLVAGLLASLGWRAEQDLNLADQD